MRDLRWIYVHMIEEYARHNGHADLLRERIDGAELDAAGVRALLQKPVEPDALYELLKTLLR